MNVRELIDELKKYDPDRKVILAGKEIEYFSPLDSISQGMYKAENERRGDAALGIEDLTPELREEGYSEEDVFFSGEKAIVLYPKWQN